MPSNPVVASDGAPREVATEKAREEMRRVYPSKAESVPGTRVGCTSTNIPYLQGRLGQQRLDPAAKTKGGVAVMGWRVLSRRMQVSVSNHN